MRTLQIPGWLRARMVEVAREFRRQPTASEAVLWKALRRHGLEGRKFRRQHRIGPFVVDFFCRSEGLVVEVDGPVHDDQRDRDAARQQLLEAAGLRVVRIPAAVVEHDLEAALDAIRAELGSDPDSAPTHAQSIARNGPAVPATPAVPPSPRKRGEGSREGGIVPAGALAESGGSGVALKENPPAEHLASPPSPPAEEPPREHGVAVLPSPLAGEGPGEGGLAINRFAFKIGTVNGTGSASANSLLLQAIFRMGIPVSGKNVFPSNIQGLPTWYEFRVSREGYTARTPEFDLVVAMNPATYRQDVAEVRSGGWLLYDSSWPLHPSLQRDDIHYLGVPLGRMCVESFRGDRERTLMKNIVYTGSLAALLNFELEVIHQIIQEKFSRKPKLLDSNYLALRLGYDYAREHLRCPLPIRLERMNATADHVMLDGNTAAALGCVYAGATVGAWYPITPATSLMDAFIAFCHRYRLERETGRKRFCIVQAEDEMAAAGVVIGAGWAGARAFTPTAGPGISLMSEFIGLAYYAEIPAVFFDVQRAGPSTGMPTRTQQADLLSVAYLSHGDTRHIVLFPADPGECFSMAVQAFDLAERFQTPVFVLSDLDIGMNDWMVPRPEWDDTYRPDRGKVLSAEELERIEKFSRYLAENGDEVAARSLPGVHPKGAFFTRGSGHNKHGAYTENPDEYREVMDRLDRKLDAAARAVPEPRLETRPGARLGLVALGGCDAAVREALDRLQERGVPLNYMRIRGFPFCAKVVAFLNAHERTFVVEQNRDAQLRSLLTLETGFPRERLLSIRDYGGVPLSAKVVVEGVERELGSVK
jgi:2-oxoglutarate/2-oxoacid ferredoxin oxidoreductase subunit alpha